jgi:hypothetical protein
VADVLSYCGSLGESAVEAAEERQTLGYDSLDPDARSVLDGFPGYGAVTEPELARLSGQPLHRVIGALPLLVAAGLVSKGPDGYQLNPPRVAS